MKDTPGSSSPTPSYIVTIDGPAGAGKSSVSRQIARNLGYNYIDTGAMFRAVALAADRRGIDWQDSEALATMLPQIKLSFQTLQGESHIFLNDEDVEKAIRTPHISQGSSQVSAHACVRTRLLEDQRVLGAKGCAVLEGRDTGSVVFPQADLKFFLDASSLERAKRRFQQLGSPAETSVEALQKEINARDQADSQRQIAPLICPEDAIRIDTSQLSFEQVIATMMQHIASKLGIS